MHGKPFDIHVQHKSDSYLFRDMPDAFIAARYHSIYADVDTMPTCFNVTAATADGIIMVRSICYAHNV